MIASASGDGSTTALDGRFGAKLAKLAGVDELIEVFGVVKLVDRYSGRTPKGLTWSAGLAKRSAADLWKTLPDGDFILIGGQVLTAFQLAARAPARWSWAHLNGVGRRVAYLPAERDVWWHAGTRTAERFLQRAARGEQAT